MAYFGKNLTNAIVTNHDNYNDLYTWSRSEPAFDTITFDYMWEKYSMLSDCEGRMYQPKHSPTLENLHVPAILYHCAGVDLFMKETFPNCVVTFWEDDSPV